MEPRIQYCKTSDGVSIAYWTMGEGGTPLVLTAPLANSHIALECEHESLASWYQQLSKNRMIVRFDPRGSGLSQRELSDEQVEQFSSGVTDVGAVVDDLALTQITMLGNAVPGTSAVCLAAERPELVERLILIALGHGPDFDRYPQLKAVLDLAKVDWKLYTETWARMFGGWSNEGASKDAEFIRRSTSQDVFVRGFHHTISLDLTPYLAKVQAKTLVMNDAAGRSGSRETARLLASGINGARFVQYAPAPFYESPEAQAAIEEFLAEGEDRPKETALRSGMTAILFLDIAGSTQLTTRLGDAAYREKGASSTARCVRRSAMREARRSRARCSATA